MSRGSTLTTTSFAVLGLLAVRPWSTYELTRQMDRSLGRIWPRAQSKLYEEPKKLVELGLAAAGTEPVGRRPRTVYAITPAGRRALAGWLAEPGAGPVIEFEQLLKVCFADSRQPGRRADRGVRGAGLGGRAQRGQPGRGPRVPGGRGSVPTPRHRTCWSGRSSCSSTGWWPTGRTGRRRRSSVAGRYFGGMRMPPSTRIVSALRYELVTHSTTTDASSSGRPRRCGNSTPFCRFALNWSDASPEP